MGAFVFRNKGYAIGNAARHFTVFVTGDLIVSADNVLAVVGAAIVFAVVTIIALFTGIGDRIPTKGAIGPAIGNAIGGSITGFAIGCIDSAITAARGVGTVGVTGSVGAVVGAIITFFVAVDFSVSAISGAGPIFDGASCGMAKLTGFTIIADQFGDESVSVIIVTFFFACDHLSITTNGVAACACAFPAIFNAAGGRATITRIGIAIVAAF